MTNESSADGWIGHWSPGIGDPTIIGWVTVFLYLLGAWQCYRLASGHSVSLRPREGRLWWMLALGLLALGINKQLDLQTALTEIGRIFAKQQGWYDRRHEVEVEFIYTILAFAAFTAIALVMYARNTHLATILAVIGSVCLLAFVTIRASSFHHVDLFISSEFLGMSMNGVMEIGGICVIITGAQWRLRADP